jgi:glycerol-3-phosphate acyltransferase PlsX
MPSVIALDAMGSDRAPKPEVEGAILAARNYGVRVLLIGPEPAIKAELDRHPAAARLPLEIVHASEVITMEDKAVQAVRAKRDSSMRVGLRLVREGHASGFVTAGNTGAAMASAKMGPGRVAWSGPSGSGGGFSYGSRNGGHPARRGRERRLQAAQSRTIRGDGRDLFPVDV